MGYVLAFIGGAIGAAASIGIWYFAYFRQLMKQKQDLQSLHNRLKTSQAALNQSATDLQGRDEQLNSKIAELEARRVQFTDLQRENTGLKQDLFNLAVQVKKLNRDHAAVAQRQEEIDQRAAELAKRYLKDTVSWVGAKLTPNNFSTSKKRLLKAIASCREIGFEVSSDEEEGTVQDLKANYEGIVREQFQREEQARIRAQIREEEKIARETEKLIKEAQREESSVRAALEKALAEAKDEHSAEIELLRAKLKDAEEKAERAISQAQLTKAGYVYVISNVGSFGESVFKIGMTRRLQPMDRVKELGDASVPFPFDVHMMISCDNAPGLENALHREFHTQRVNKVNFRKEYFRTDFDTIRKIVEDVHGEVDYTAEPVAIQYRETQDMPEEDFDFIERTMESLVAEEEVGIDDD